MLPNNEDLLRKQDPEITKYLKLFLRLAVIMCGTVFFFLTGAGLIFLFVWKNITIFLIGIALSLIVGLTISYNAIKGFYNDNK